MDSIIAGVDIGGTHITAALVDINRKVILRDSVKRMSVDSKATAENIISAWSKVIRTSFDTYQMEPTKLGMAMPGPFDYKKWYCPDEKPG